MTLDALFATVTPKIGRILDKALADSEINVNEAETLFHAKGLDVLAVMAAADQMRRRQVGELVTYVKVRNINFTNV
ncbi:MAG: 7,8-didemethyl-8-hydroxy-5-deazariboflavin synthase subunit CofH, partial [Ardenticatenaceae bacterium]